MVSSSPSFAPSSPRIMSPTFPIRQTRTGTCLHSVSCQALAERILPHSRASTTSRAPPPFPTQRTHLSTLANPFRKAKQQPPKRSPLLPSVATNDAFPQRNASYRDQVHKASLITTALSASRCSSSFPLSTSLPCSSFSTKYDPTSIPNERLSDSLDFQQCKNPIQLEKSIAYYLESHPYPAEEALLAMLTACLELNTASSSSYPSRNPLDKRSKQSDRKHSKKSETSPSKDFAGAGAGLLETILQSSTFSSDQVFKIACHIHDDVALKSPSRHIDSKGKFTPSLQVTNSFLGVCASAGQFSRARTILQDMTQREQGGVKPDLVTFRNVLKAAAEQRRQQREHRPFNDAEAIELESTTRQIIDLAADSLAQQARISFWIKMGLGGLVGATVGKFTMMGVMALPAEIFGKRQVRVEEISDVLGSSRSVVEMVVGWELATGVGLAVGMLTAGYFILGSSRPMASSAGLNPATDSSGTSAKPFRQHAHQRDSLPREKRFGFYFPDLATTNKDEIRDYLKRTVGP